MLSTLVLSSNYFFLNQQNNNDDSLIQHYSLNYTNKSIFFIVYSNTKTNLHANIIIDNQNIPFTSISTKIHNLTFSFPGKQFLLTASLSYPFGPEQLFLINKSVYQPPVLFISQFPQLNESNQTKVIFKTNIELDNIMSHVQYLNSTSNAFFYQLAYLITFNKSITIIDKYYRSFSINVNTIYTFTSPIQTPPYEGDPINDTTPIIVINGTISQSIIKIINNTILDETISHNATEIISSSLTRSKILSNYSFVSESSFIFSNFTIIKEATVFNTNFFNTTIFANKITINNSSLINTTIFGSMVSIINSIIDSSEILVDKLTSQNNTYINQMTCFCGN